MRSTALPAIPSPRRDRQISLGDQIARLSALISAATAQLLDLIREFDDSDGWYEEGFKSCAQWLSWRTGIAPGAARERVRVARALADLPDLSAALGAGELSYSVARALTRVATAENETRLVETARHSTAADLERLVKAWRAADRAEDEGDRADEDRYGLSVTPLADGSWSVDGHLSPEDGAMLRRALETASAELGEGGSAENVDREEARHGGEEARSARSRRADVLALLVEAAVGRGLSGGEVSRADTCQVIIDVPAETLIDDAARRDDTPGVGEIEGGVHVSAETCRRVTCDATVVGVKLGIGRGDGAESEVGRRRRAVSKRMRELLVRRDRTCRFPGCTSRFCDAHHVKHWADGGETTLDNLVLLCRHHHRRVHEFGWRMTFENVEHARFYRPDGTELDRVPSIDVCREEAGKDQWGVGWLEQAQGQRLNQMDAWTPTPDSGEKMDIDWALLALRP